MIQIFPSILASNFSTLKEELPKLEKAKVHGIHFDVMDNHFVPNLTFGAKFIEELRDYTRLSFDIHLMIENPRESLGSFLKTGADEFSFHIESLNPSQEKEEVLELAEAIHERGKKFCLAIKPKTAIKVLKPYLELLDRILLMTVEPGFSGQVLIPETMQKLTQLKTMLSEQEKNIPIQVDGGVHLGNLQELNGRGADIAVLGQAFFSGKPYDQIMQEIYDPI